MPVAEGVKEHCAGAGRDRTRGDRSRQPDRELDLAEVARAVGTALEVREDAGPVPRGEPALEEVRDGLDALSAGEPWIEAHQSEGLHQRPPEGPVNAH